MFKNKLVFSVFLFAVGGCGVHVGNGLRKYSNPHGFEMQYNESLTLRESDDKKTVTISDNKEGTRVRATTQESSYAEFKVRSDRQAGSTAQLKQLANAESPGRQFEESNVNGSIGVKSIHESDGRFTALYYFTTTKNEVVRLDIYAKSSSKNLFAPIGESYKGGGNAAGVAEHHLVPVAIEVPLHDAVDINFPVGGPVVKVVPLPLAVAGHEPRPSARSFQFASGLVVTMELTKHRPEYWVTIAELPNTVAGTGLDRAALVHAGFWEDKDKKLLHPFKAYLIRATNELDLSMAASENFEEEACQEDLKNLFSVMKFKHAVTDNKLAGSIADLMHLRPSEPLRPGPPRRD